MAESTSDDQFKILQREIRESIRRNHPNPKRIGCPGTSTLRSMAEANAPPSDPGYRHVMECSPCYEELMDLTAVTEAVRAETKSRRRRRVLGFSVAGGVLAFGIVAYIVSQRALDQPRTPPPVAAGKDQSQSPPGRALSPSLAVAMLNLDSETTVRGSGQERRATELQRLPRKKLDLTINLPRGLEEGNYELELVSDGSPAALTMKGVAKIEEGLTVLRLQPDLSPLAPGQYHLRLRRSGSAWRESEVLLF
jgi:hypothetical protein